jgi:hypothetical protein
LCVQRLLEEDIIERSQSFNYNSPVWPVKKPNGTYRFTVDYRKINELTPQVPGNLLEVAELFSKLQAGAYTWFSIIDLLDMFFAIPLDEESRELTIFTWDNKHYQFKWVPQG